MNTTQQELMLQKWGYAFTRAQRVFELKQTPHCFYLDDRYYTDSEKVEFFKDLQVADNQTWEYLTTRITKRKCGSSIKP